MEHEWLALSILCQIALGISTPERVILRPRLCQKYHCIVDINIRKRKGLLCSAKFFEKQKRVEIDFAAISFFPFLFYFILLFLSIFPIPTPPPKLS
jgi:hypothetical protein